MEDLMRQKYDKISDEKINVALKKFDKSDDFIKRIRIFSVQRGETIGSIVRTALLEYMAKCEGENDI
jgi:hypothetical protein